MFLAACLVDSAVELLATYMRAISMVCLEHPRPQGPPRDPFLVSFSYRDPTGTPQDPQGPPGDPFLAMSRLVCRFAVLQFCRSAILPFCNFAVLQFCRSAVLPSIARGAPPAAEQSMGEAPDMCVRVAVAFVFFWVCLFV